MIGLRQVAMVSPGIPVLRYPGKGDLKIADCPTFEAVLAELHPRQFFTAHQFHELRAIWNEQRAIRAAAS